MYFIDTMLNSQCVCTLHTCIVFSFPGGESGSADTARDPRGFAMKFYTEDGNWDLVGNNTPIFFIRDPMQVFARFTLLSKRLYGNITEYKL